MHVCLVKGFNIYYRLHTPFTPSGLMANIVIGVSVPNVGFEVHMEMIPSDQVFVYL